MGYNNPPGIPAPKEGQDERARPTGTTEATHGMWTTDDAYSGLAEPPLSSMPPDIDLNWDDILGHSSFLNEFDNGLFANAEIGANSSRGNTEVSIFPRQSAISYPEVSTMEPSTSGNNYTANHLTNNFFPGGYREPEDQVNFMPVGSYGIKEHVAEAKVSGHSGLPMQGIFSPSGTSISSSTDKSSLQHVPHSAGKVDGDFLTLRTGGGTELGHSSHFASKETSSKLERTASAQPSSSHAVHRTTNPLSIEGSSNNATRVQTGLSGFANMASSSANNPWRLAGAANNATRVQPGIGGFANFANSHFIPKEESPSAQLNSFPARHNVNNTLSIAAASSNTTRIQTSAGGLPSSANNLIDRIPTSDRGAIITDNPRPNSFEFHSLQTPEAHGDSSRSDHMPSLMPFANTSVPYTGHFISPGLPLQQFRPSQSTTSQSLLAPQQVRPSQFTTNQSFLAPQQVRPSQFTTSQSFLAPQQVRPSKFTSSQSFLALEQVGTSQFSTSQSLLPLQHGRSSNIATSPSNFYEQQNLYGQRGRSTADAFTNSVYGSQSGITMAHPGLRNPTPLAEATRHESVPRSVQPVGQLYPRHNAGSADALRDSYPPSYGAVPFPRRLGVQPNDFTTAQRIRGPSRTAAQVNPSRPIPATGQHPPGSAASHPTAPRPRVVSSSGQANRVEKLNVGPQPSPKLNRQSSKRPATEKPPSASAPASQRRRVTKQPSTNPHQSQSNRVPGPATARTPAASPLRVKGPDPEELPVSTGHKCYLCKRDLEITSEGQYQPRNPQISAVLPCGHTFHPECLEKITPPDQIKEPPCIPCALGEN